MLVDLFDKQLTQTHAQILVAQIKQNQLFVDDLPNLRKIIKFVQTHPKYVEQHLRNHRKLIMILRNHQLESKLIIVLHSDLSKIKHFNQFLNKLERM